MDDLNNRLRSIPPIDWLVAAAAATELAELPRDLLVELLRAAADIVRGRLKEDNLAEASGEAVFTAARRLLADRQAISLRRVVNATGVILHTNLGRAPLSERARARVQAVLAGYCNLEYDTASGERGSRYEHVAARIAALAGAEAALAVNNNAAAVMLALSTLAYGRAVIVSRGQLVEIGGSFRVPEVMAQSGARLVEVGTTNKTHLADYERAIGPDTAAILKVHTSNYRIVGFTAQPEDAALAALAAKHDLPLIEDLGSGTILPVTADGWREPAVGERVAAGMDVVTFSGDKLFGGAQAGLIAGREKYVGRMRKNPLLRALRIDKLSLAALEGTLLDYLAGRPQQDIPVQAMLNMDEKTLAARAIELANELSGLAGWQIETIPITSQAGGGSLPAVALPSRGVRLRPRLLSTAAAEARLRQRATPIVIRVQDDSLILDVRCLQPGDSEEIKQALSELGEGEQA